MKMIYSLMCWNVLELSNFYTVESFCRAYCFQFQWDLLITICGRFFFLCFFNDG